MNNTTICELCCAPIEGAEVSSTAQGCCVDCGIQVAADFQLRCEEPAYPTLYPAIGSRGWSRLQSSEGSHR